MAEQPMIVVRGEATREVPPELAVFSVTASARDRDRQTALTRLTERAAALRGHLDGFADAIERRETSGVQVRPELKRGGGERVAAYSGSVTTTVTVTDFGVLGELLLRLADQDQVSVSGPWWQLRPGSRAGAEVRRAAIADALGRAREYAEAVGAEVDRLVEILDEGTGGGAQPMMRMAAFGGAPEADLELDVDPQRQTVQAAVIVRVTITEPTALKPAQGSS
ncbi:SIMPL domain-containing protein [Actinoplanes sp. NPDC049118]|uniref:SIMPL domain-containing protein n=1 Tax=Actinoplanes sp. NPDC049118 TaxID=3155769 RepID=UPI0033F6BE1C